MENKEQVLDFEYNNHKVHVSYAYGNNDGYYWDKIFFLIIDQTPYIMLEIGSGSGWVPNNNSLKKVSFDYLKNRKKENNTSLYNDVTISDFDQKLFKRLFDFMIENKASEVNETDEFDTNTNDYIKCVVECDEDGK